MSRASAPRSYSKTHPRQKLLRLEPLEDRRLLNGEFWLSALSVTGQPDRPFDKLEVTFSNPVNVATFGSSDITLSRSGVDLNPTITQLDTTRFELDFGGQTGLLDYTLVIGPNITDTGAQDLDQNRDGTTGDSFQAALFASDIAIPEGDGTYDDQSLIFYDSTSTIDGPHSFADVQLLGGSTLAHSATTTTDEYRLDLAINDSLIVDAASKIDVTECGYLPGYTLGNTTVGAATGWAGGSYGGQGVGATNETYGDYRDPNELGSGGSAEYVGKPGGGLVRISAAQMQIDGAIRADGGQETVLGHSTAAGSGGGIRLDAGTISGAGLISARGATEWWDGEQSGGGRIAVYYDTNDGFDLENNVTTAFSASIYGPAPGTVYLEKTGGPSALRIASPEIPAGAQTPIPGSALNVDQLVVSGLNVYATFKDEMTIDIGELIVSDNATLEVATPNPTDVAMVDTLDLSNGAVLTHRAATTTDEYTLRLLADTVTVDATSSIDVSARGYLPGHTLGNTTVGAATGWAGGSYAGEGVGDTNETYGDYRDPNELGSGGSADYAGLAGGGLVRIDANTLQLDGTIRADGGQGTVQGHSRAAGSGGGIKIDVGTLSGSGLISAKGGSEWWNGDQSGGGRIAVYFDTNTGFNLDNKVTTAAGGSVYDPSPGTVYIEQNGGEKLLRIFSPEIPPGAKTPIPGSMLEVDRLIVSGKNVYAMPKDTMSINVEELTVSDGATFEVALPDFNDTFTVATVDLLGGGVLTHRAATATQEFALRMTVDTLTIDATSAVDATNRGYMAGHTYGNTTIRAATGIAGGSYGGLGEAFGDTTNWVYGDYRDPNELGSGGGGNQRDQGGGLVRIVADTINLDGAIRANGKSTGTGGNDWPSPGSGGGIRLDVGTLRGTGTISSIGGWGGWNRGPGGGGRIAVYYDTLDGFDLGNVTAVGGGEGATGDDNAGAPGTVYLVPSSGPDVLRIASQYRPTAAWTPLAVDDPSLDLLEISGDGLKVGADGRTMLRVGDVLVTNGATLELASLQGDPGLVCGDLNVTNGSLLTHRKTTIYDEYFLQVVADTVTIDDTSSINVDTLGYDRGYTIGNTTVGASTYGAGGSYGGLGSTEPRYGTPNAVYDDPANPKHPGSGGGGHWYSNGAEGGGCVQITAETFTLNGEIHADGATGLFPGGSGGGVRLNLGTLNGTGTITAAGGGGVGDAGAGGGGRIAIYARDENTLPPENVTAKGGTISYYPAEDGTIAYPTEPFYDWDWPLDEFWHDTERLRWTGLGLDPAEVTVDLEAFNGLDVYPIATGLAPVGLFDWDTAGVPNDAYEVRAIFRDSGGTPIETLRKDVLVDNSFVWHEGTIYGNQTWAGDRVHVLSKSVTVANGATLTIEPGAVIKLAAGTAITVVDGGTLDAPATETNPIVVTLLTDDAIAGDTNHDGSLTQPYPGQAAGIRVVGAGQLNLSDHVELRYNVVTIVQGTINADKTIGGHGAIVVISGDMQVASDVVLTIPAGTVMKFADSAQLMVGGTLNAQGTVEAPVVFTSLQDDTVGGDTTGDGSASTPAPNDWDGIYITKVGGTVRLDHCDVRYAYYGVETSAAEASWEVTNSVIRDNVIGLSAHHRANLSASASNCLIIDNSQLGVYFHEYFEGILRNCTIVGNGYGGGTAAGVHHVGTLTMESCIVAHNANGVDSNADPQLDIRNSIFYQPLGKNLKGSGIEGNDILTRNNNQVVDPRLVDYASGDYQLANGSPAIDAAYSAQSPLTDMRGLDRYDDPGMPNIGSGYPVYADVGALERQSDTVAPDLDVTDVTLPAESYVSAGQSIDISWTVKNFGTVATQGGWNDRVYLSKTEEFSSDAILLGSVARPEALEPLAMYSGSLQVTLPETTGLFYVLVRADADNDLHEPTRQNNDAASPQVLAIDVPVLTLDNPHDFTATVGQWSYFRLPGDVGPTIQVNMTGPAEARAQLYVLRGHAPTAQRYNDAGVLDNTANQEVRILVPEQTDYYVGVQLLDATANTANLTLTAKRTEFGIRQISTDTLGSTGTGTVEILGDNLTETTQATLIGDGGATIEADEYFWDAGTIYASFYLLPSDVGVYDLRIADAGQQATQTSAITVVESQKPHESDFTVDVDIPAMARTGRTVIATITYTNNSLQDIAAPLLRLTASEAITWSLSSYVVDGDTCYVMALSSTGRADVLRAGQTEQLEISLKLPQTGVTLSVDVESLVPGLSSGADDKVWQGWIGGPEGHPTGEELMGAIGDTWGDYVEALGSAAEEVKPFQGLIYSYDRLAPFVDAMSVAASPQPATASVQGARAAEAVAQSAVAEPTNPIELRREPRLSLPDPSLLVYSPSDDQWHYAHSPYTFLIDPVSLAPLFYPNRRTVLIVHGHDDSMGHPEWRAIARKLSQNDNVNVLGFDWSDLANSYNPTVTALAIPTSALICAARLDLLGVSPSSLHIVGHSHGAHLSGMIAEFLKFNGRGVVDRVTALDASPEITHNPNLGIATGAVYHSRQIMDILALQDRMAPLLKGWRGYGNIGDVDTGASGNVYGQGWGAARGSASFIDFYKTSERMSGTTLWGNDNFLVVKDNDAWGDGTFLGIEIGLTEHSFSTTWFSSTIADKDSGLGYWWSSNAWSNYQHVVDTVPDRHWNGIIHNLNGIECLPQEWTKKGSGTWNYAAMRSNGGYGYKTPWHRHMLAEVAQYVDFSVDSRWIRATSNSDDGKWHAGGSGQLKLEVNNEADNVAAAKTYKDIWKAAQLGGNGTTLDEEWSFAPLYDWIYLSVDGTLDGSDLFLGRSVHRYMHPPQEETTYSRNVYLPSWDKIRNTLGETSDHYYYVLIDVAGANSQEEIRELWAPDNLGSVRIAIDPVYEVTAVPGEYPVYWGQPGGTRTVQLDGSQSQPLEWIHEFTWEIWRGKDEPAGQPPDYAMMGVRPTVDLTEGVYYVRLTVRNIGPDGKWETEDDLTDVASTLLRLDSVVGKKPEEIDWTKKDRAAIRVTQSYTPEDKWGPVGYDEPGTAPDEQARWIRADEELDYHIEFWNKQDAVVPTQDAIIIDQLDPASFDLTTLELTRIGFLDWDVLLEGVRVIDTTIDCRPEMNIMVEVKAGLGMTIPGFANNDDINDSTLVWWFHCIDPETGTWPEDPYAGFLPPFNPNTGFEIGWVDFTVDPVQDLSTATELANVAYVEFDFAGDIYDHPAPKVDPEVEPAEPNPWVNTIDADKPSGTVLPLNAQQNANQFVVEWSGTDVGSGIATYSIFVREDDAPWQLWLADTAETSASFTGRLDHTYTFSAVATDNVGNVEQSPNGLQAEAVTTVVQGIGLELGDDVLLQEGDTLAITMTTANLPAGSTATVDYGDGSGSQPLTIAPDGSVDLSHVYDDNGLFDLTVTISDPLAEPVVGGVRVAVANVAPTITDLAGDAAVDAGATATFDSVVSDPADAADTLTHTWDFGDGTPPVSGIDLNTTDHVFLFGGQYAVTLVVADDDGGTDTETIPVSVTGLTPVDLGTVDFTLLQNLDVAAQGEMWFTLEAARDGYLAVEATINGELTLYDQFGSEPPLGMATAAGGKARADWAVTAAERYLIHLAGTSTDAELRVVNLVTPTGTEVQVFGTDGADAFEFAPTGSYTVTINGVDYDFDDTRYETIVFTGGLGDDTATLTGGPGEETARFYPDHGTFGENGFLVTVNEVTAITAHGGGGQDFAFMYDSPGDDEFIARRDYGRLSGEGFVLETHDFMFNYGYANPRTGGNDVAYMEDTADDDKFKFDWPNPGQFFGKMYGGGEYYNRAKYFERIVATMTDGANRVRLFDSEGDETFYGQKDESQLVGDGFDVTVSGYDHLVAYASTGLDVAHLVDSDDDDTTRARPHKITLWGGDDADPTYTIIARRFDEYHFAGTHAGFDRAKLHDTALSDHVDADDDTASFYLNDDDLDLLYEVAAFDWVRLYATEGGTQNTIKKKDPINFGLIYETAMWDEMP